MNVFIIFFIKQILQFFFDILLLSIFKIVRKSSIKVFYLLFYLKIDIPLSLGRDMYFLIQQDNMDVLL